MKWTNSLKIQFISNKAFETIIQIFLIYIYIYIYVCIYIYNNLPKQKAPSPNGFTGEFSETFKEEIMPRLHNPFQKIKAEGIIYALFHEANITTI